MQEASESNAICINKPNSSQYLSSKKMKILRPTEQVQSVLNSLEKANLSDPASLSESTQLTPLEIDAAFEKFNDLFSFDQSSGQLNRNRAVLLNPDEEQVVQQLLHAYDSHRETNEIQLERRPDGLFIPLTEVAEETRQGLANSPTQDKLPNESALEPDITSKQMSDSILAQRCTWRWTKKWYWWGVRISLNRCGCDYIIGAGSAISVVLAAMGITGWIAAAIRIVVGILKAFCNSNGVRIYITWAGGVWVTGG